LRHLWDEVWAAASFENPAPGGPSLLLGFAQRGGVFSGLVGRGIGGTRWRASWPGSSVARSAGVPWSPSGGGRSVKSTRPSGGRPDRSPSRRPVGARGAPGPPRRKAPLEPPSRAPYRPTVFASEALGVTYILVRGAVRILGEELAHFPDARSAARHAVVRNFSGALDGIDLAKT